MLMFRARFSSLFEDIKCEYNNLKEPPIIFYRNFKRGYGDNINMEMEFIEANPFNNDLFDYLKKRNMHRYIFCCTEKNTKDLNIALFMPQKFVSDSTLYLLQKHGTQFVKKLDYCSSFHTFGVFQSSLNVYQYLHDVPNDLHERYDSCIETANLFENQGNFKQAYHYKKAACIVGAKLFENFDKKSVLGYYSLENARELMNEGWELYQKWERDNWQDWSIVQATECFARAIDIIESVLGKTPETIEGLKELAEAYEGQYLTFQDSRINDWRGDYERHMELTRMINEKQKEKCT